MKWPLYVYWTASHRLLGLCLSQPTQNCARKVGWRKTTKMQMTFTVTPRRATVIAIPFFSLSPRHLSFCLCLHEMPFVNSLNMPDKIKSQIGQLVSEDKWHRMGCPLTSLKLTSFLKTSWWCWWALQWWEDNQKLFYGNVGSCQRFLPFNSSHHHLDDNLSSATKWMILCCTLHRFPHSFDGRV